MPKNTPKFELHSDPKTFGCDGPRGSRMVKSRSLPLVIMEFFSFAVWLENQIITIPELLSMRFEYVIKTIDFSFPIIIIIIM